MERFNCWTGTTTTDIDSNSRVVTDGPNTDGQLFRAEYWGDYSLAFPKRGPWRKSKADAARDIARLKL